MQVLEKIEFENYQSTIISHVTPSNVVLKLEPIASTYLRAL